MKKSVAKKVVEKKTAPKISKAMRYKARIAGLTAGIDKRKAKIAKLEEKLKNLATQ